MTSEASPEPPTHSDDPAVDPAAGSSNASAVIWGVAGVLIVVVLFAALQILDKPPEATRSALLPPSKLELLDRQVLERSGEEMSTHDLLKGPVIANFMFTNCPTTCPPLSKAMLRLQEATTEMSDVTLASFTVDPKRDTVEALSQYADRLGADPTRWKFLFTNEATVHDIAFDGLGIGHHTEVIAHSNKFVLLDRTGKARGFYEPLQEQDWLEVLIADLAKLRAEASE